MMNRMLIGGLAIAISLVGCAGAGDNDGPPAVKGNGTTCTSIDLDPEAPPCVQDESPCRIDLGDGFCEVGLCFDGECIGPDVGLRESVADDRCRAFCVNEFDGGDCGPNTAIDALRTGEVDPFHADGATILSCYRGCRTQYENEVVRGCEDQFMEALSCYLDLDCDDALGDCDAITEAYTSCTTPESEDALTE